MFLYGELNLSALEFALNAVIKRQKSLRTVFRKSAISRKYIQIVKVQDKIKLPIIDVSNNESPVESLLEIIRTDSHEPFSIRKGPLAKFKLVKISPNYHVFLYSIHHLLSDGSSTAIFFKELSQYYNSFINKDIPVLPPLNKSFAGCCYDIDLRRRSIKNSSTIEYWSNLLKPPYALATLLKDSKRTPPLSLKTYELPVSINKSLIASVNEYCKKHGITLNSMLLSIWSVFMAETYG